MGGKSQQTYERMMNQLNAKQGDGFARSSGSGKSDAAYNRIMEQIGSSGSNFQDTWKRDYDSVFSGLKSGNVAESMSKARQLINSYNRFMPVTQKDSTREYYESLANLNSSYRKSQAWANRYNSTMQGLTDYNKSLNGGWTADASGGKSADIQALIDSASDFTGFAGEGSADDYIQELKDRQNAIAERNQYYSQWKDADSYDRYRSNYGAYGNYENWSNSMPEEQQAALRADIYRKDKEGAANAEKGYTQAKEAYRNAKAALTIANQGGTPQERYAAQQAYLQAKDAYEKADREYSRLTASARAYENTWGKLDRYGDTMKQAAAANVDTSYNGKSFTQMVRDKDTDIPDPLGLYKSYVAENGENYTVPASGGNSVHNPVFGTIRRAKLGDWDRLTDHETETYYYLLNNQGKEAAVQYLDDLTIELNRRRQQERDEAIENADSAAERVLQNAASIPANVFGAFPAFVDSAISIASGEGMNPYSYGNALKNFATQVRENTGEDIGEAVNKLLQNADGTDPVKSKVANLAMQTYQALMSGADSMLGAVTLGSVPYTISMGMGAAADRASEMYLNGASNGQIITGAIASGVIESLSEYISVEHFAENFLQQSPQSVKDWIKKTFVQGLCEGGEEVESEVANAVYDSVMEALRTGYYSDRERAVDAYISQGMTEQQANAQFLADKAVDTLWSFYGGFISATASSAAVAGVNAGKNTVENTVQSFKTGRDIMEAGNVSALSVQAQEIGDGKASQKLQRQAKAAETAAEKYSSTGKGKLNAEYKAGKTALNIAKEAANQATTAKSTEYKTVAAEYLKSLGVKATNARLDVLDRAYQIREGKKMIDSGAVKDSEYTGLRYLDAAEKAIYNRMGGDKALSRIDEFMENKGIDLEQLTQKRQEQASRIYRNTAKATIKESAQPTEERYSVSGTGYGYVNRLDENGNADLNPVNVNGVATTGENFTVKLSDGTTAKATDVVYPDSGTASIYSTLAQMDISPEDANLLLEGFDQKDILKSEKSYQAGKYAAAIADIYNLALAGDPLTQVSAGYGDEMLSQPERQLIYNLAREHMQKQTESAQAQVKRGFARAENTQKTAYTSENGLKFENDIQDYSKFKDSLSGTQRGVVELAEVLSKAGMDITFFESTEEQRKAGIPNGTYDQSTGAIRLDLNAGMNGEGVVAFTAAHEVTHFLESYAPKKFQSYVDTLFTVMDKQGYSVDAMLKANLAEAQQENPGKTKAELAEIARSETAAKLSESMLTDTEALQQFSSLLKQQDQSLWSRIKKWFNDFAAKLRNAYKSLDPYTEEGKAGKAAFKQADNLAKLWAEGLKEAVENYNGQNVQKNNAPEGVRYSLRGYTEQQKKNWENSKRIVIYDSQQQLYRFISDSIKNKTMDKKMYFGAVSSELAARIKTDTGIDVENYNLSLGSYEVRKILKDHGNEAKEAARGQRAIVAEDFGHITDVILNPTSIALSEQDYMGKPAIVFSGENNGKMNVVAVVSDKRLDLFVQTVYTNVKKGNLATPTGEQAPINTPKANSSTVSVDNISQPAEDVKGNVLKSSRTDSAGHTLSEAQTKYFENSEVRDENGNLKVVYHGSPAVFTEFSSDFLGTHGSAEGQGFYFTDYKQMAEGYQKNGGQLLEGYLNIQNPLSDSTVTLSRAEVRKLLRALDPTGDDLVLNYDTMGGIGYPSKSWYNRSLNDTLNTVMRNESDSEILAELANAMGDYGAVLEKARSVLGYDGYIVSGKYDNATVYVAFDSSQFKNIDNQNPTDSKDIRFSKRTTVELLEYQKQLLEIQKNGNIQNLVDPKELRKMAKAILQAADSKMNVQELADSLQKMVNFIQTSEMDDAGFFELQDMIDQTIDTLDENRQFARDFYDQSILDSLKKRRIRLSESQIAEVKREYGSLKDFRSALKGTVILDQKNGMSLDEFWQEMGYEYSNIFSDEVNEGDQPAELASIVERMQEFEDPEAAYYRQQEEETRRSNLRQTILDALTDAPNRLMSKKAALNYSVKTQEQIIESYKQEQTAQAEAMRKAYEIQRQKIALKYQQQMAELESQADGAKAEAEKAFIEIAKQVEEMQGKLDAANEELSVLEGVNDYNTRQAARESRKSQKQIDTLREKLNSELSTHREDNAIWKQEFSRLLRQYESKSNTVKNLESKISKQQETAKAKVENKRRTEARLKLVNAVNTLNRMLLRPTENSHIPERMKAPVAESLKAINSAFDADTVSQTEKRIARYEERIQELRKQQANATSRAKYYDCEADIAAIQDSIRNLRNKSQNMQNTFVALESQYNSLQNAADPESAAMWDSVVSNMLSECKNLLDGKTISQLSAGEIQYITDTYRAMAKRISDANKAFLKSGNAKISDLAQQAVASLKKHTYKSNDSLRALNEFSWNNEKSYYAFERMENPVLTELYKGLRQGEDTWATDIADARAYFVGSAAQWGYNNWDKSKTWEFESTSGQKFKLNVEQIMSLYAYSRRGEQAINHIRNGGIVLDGGKWYENGLLGKLTEKQIHDATAYNISIDTLSEILSKLTPEQKAFARDMQAYLSTVMGEKGNTVSMALYDVKKFTEEFYWPLRSSRDYMAIAKEQDMNQGNKVKNKGFTKAVVQHASNPIVLNGLTDTWASHVNDMSMYHAFTLPMEDFYRVWNWSSVNKEGMQSVSTSAAVKNAFGDGAVKYVETFLRDLNGGARSDPRETVWKRVLSGFKKSAVLMSASVAIQQPSAVGRAFSVIEPKYFVGSKVETDGKAWEQAKKYAPVCIIKDMGFFDMGMGLSTNGYLTAKEYDGFAEKAKAVITDSDYRDSVMGWAPGKMDEITWSAIWNAAKRKAASETGLKGDALLKKAGEIFTDCIVQTQVYDSVFTRSANMRSKSIYMNMLTSFMAEPTTTINMVESAVRHIKSGNKAKAAKMFASCAVATVLNSALAAIVYAARDDDKDKTYLEKYLASFTGEMLEGINPITYIPFAQDAWNLALGYDVERSDLTLVSSFIAAFNKTAKLAQKDTSNMTEAQKQAYAENLKSTIWADVDAIMNLFGIPEKNIRRDIMAVKNLLQATNWQDTSANTAWNAIVDEAFSDIPILNQRETDKKTDRLYDAYTSGDSVYKQRMNNLYSSQQALETALVKSMRDNDPRIKQAAQAQLSGDSEERIRIAKEIKAEGMFHQDIIVKAINAEISAAKSGASGEYTHKAQSLYTADDFVKAAGRGLGSAVEMRAEIIRTAVANGKSEEEAESAFTSSAKSATQTAYVDNRSITAEQAVKALEAIGANDPESTVAKWRCEVETGIQYSDLKDAYLNGEITDNEAVDMLTTYGGYTQEKAEEKVTEYRAERDTGVAYGDIADALASGTITPTQATNMYMEYGGLSQEDAEDKVVAAQFKAETGLEVSTSFVEKYTANSKPAGIDPQTAYEAWKYYNSTSNIDTDGDGKADIKKMQQVFEYINALSLTAAQKDALALQLGYKTKTLWKAPWH